MRTRVSGTAFKENIRNAGIIRATDSALNGRTVQFFKTMACFAVSRNVNGLTDAGVNVMFLCLDEIAVEYAQNRKASVCRTSFGQEVQLILTPLRPELMEE
jgi:hypothetical protein